MIMNAIAGRRWTLMLGAAAAAIGMGMATPAQAYGHHGWGWGGWGWGPRVGFGIGFLPYYGYAYAPPVYYAPPPVYYYPPRPYYAPSSVTVAPPAPAHRTVRHHVTHKTTPPCGCPPAQSGAAPTSAPAKPLDPGQQANAGALVDQNTAY